jgi:hypothetical protein
MHCQGNMQTTEMTAEGLVRREVRQLSLLVATLLTMLVLSLIGQRAVFAQSATTGSINGTVVDSSGAVVPNASVTVRDTANNSVLNLKSNEEGRFTAPFLKPDNFNISATAPGLKSATATLQVLTGQQSAVTITLSPEANTQTVEVTANDAQLIDTQTSNTITTFTTQQFQNLPAPGGDITTIAFTVPGVVLASAPSFPTDFLAFPIW